MRTHLNSERGSIPAVLITSIIVGGLVVVLVAAVLINQRTARFDRSFTGVLQEADEYAQEGAHHVIRRTWDTDGTDPVGQTYQISGATTCPPVADGDICMTATKVSPLRWEVEAEAAERTTGTDVVTRKVSIDIVDNVRFFLAAFADTSLQLRGANAATSYGDGVWYTDHGLVGTNGDVTLNGNSTDVDGVQLYNWDNDADLSRCTHLGGSGCNDVKALPNPVAPSDRIGPRLEVGSDRLQTQFIDDAIAGCESANGGVLPSYTSSTDGGLLLDDGDIPTCVENLTFDTDVTVDPTSGPIEVYVSGQFSIANGASINCPSAGCNPGTPGNDPDSTRLLIYSAGGDVTIGNHADVVAGIYAPRSECKGNPSNAQGRIFGSMICDTIDNQGGWQFLYDDKLETVGTGVFEQDDYREE